METYFKYFFEFSSSNLLSILTFLSKIEGAIRNMKQFLGMEQYLDIKFISFNSSIFLNFFTSLLKRIPTDSCKACRFSSSNKKFAKQTLSEAVSFSVVPKYAFPPIFLPWIISTDSKLGISSLSSSRIQLRSATLSNIKQPMPFL